LTGLTQIVVYWPTVDSVLIGIMFKRNIYTIDNYYMPHLIIHMKHYYY
jgi:hypothetical protein